MDQDLKLIKKKYGENMAKLCREFFPTLLETNGLLPELLITHFEPSHSLYKDLVIQKQENNFKNYIYSLVDIENKIEINSQKSPKELLSEAGYNLYECKTEEEIQKFKKYYAKGEQLCTFNGGRLDRCRVFFAVKKDVNKIKRRNYRNPQRQDEYGTSVISIQFTNDPTHTLSIKNRYNHKVNNPDSTFSNNLDNIIKGLTKSFENEYGLVQQYKNNYFEIQGYVVANDGKHYKYNQEVNNIYYCPNNIIIDNYEVKRYEKEKYILMDYFIVDLVNKEIKFYDEKITDAFLDTIGNIEKIEIEKKKLEKQLIIKVKNREDIKIILNENNEIIRLTNPNVERVGNQFLYLNTALQDINLPNLQKIGDYFLYDNELLQELNLPKLKEAGTCFLRFNSSLKELSLPNLEKIKNYFLYRNECLQKLNLPNLEEVGDYFLTSNKALQVLTLPNLQKVGNSFLYYNEILEKINLPKLQEVGHDAFHYNKSLKELFLPNIQKIGFNFLNFNTTLEKLNMPNVQEIGGSFLIENRTLKEINLPKVKEVGDNFLYINDALQELDLPNLQIAGNYFLSLNRSLEVINLPKIEEKGSCFLLNQTLKEKDKLKDIKVKSK